MELDIDLNDRRQVLQARDDIARLIKIVDFAIENTPRIETRGLPLGDKFIWDIVETLPDRFSTTDIIVALGTIGKEKRGLVKCVLARAVQAKLIAVLVRGRGRRPTSYFKVMR